MQSRFAIHVAVGSTGLASDDYGTRLFSVSIGRRLPRRAVAFPAMVHFRTVVAADCATRGAAMTKRDYELIAETLRESNAPLKVRLAMADALQLDNPRFDARRFLVAAYPKGKRPSV